MLKYLDEIDLKNKKVIARFDFNVPLNQEGVITDTTRIDRSLESIRYILDQGATLTMIGHLGRPKGMASPQYSLRPVASYLALQLGIDIVLTTSCLDSGMKQLLSLPTTKAVLLENVRFHREEEENDHEFAKILSHYGDIYVNDAFGVCHRRHASIDEITTFFRGKSVGGLLLRREIEALERLIQSPRRPFVAIIGGKKVSDKITLLESLLRTVDVLIIGGAMAYPFLQAKKLNVGSSLCSTKDIQYAQGILSHISSQKIKLPLDHIIASSVDDPHPHVNPQADILQGDMMGLDIGPKTMEHFSSFLSKANTVLWNGPMGLFEREAFSQGTLHMANVLSSLNAFTFVGGGDSVHAVKQAKVLDKINHISTGGGASLEYIKTGLLPGIRALQ